MTDALLAYAQKVFDNNREGGEPGRTVERTTLNAIEILRRNKRLTPDIEEQMLGQIELPEIPAGAERVWDVYVSVREHCLGERVNLLDVWAWTWLYGIELYPWEIDVIFEMDRLWQKVANEEAKKAAKK